MMREWAYKCCTVPAFGAEVEVFWKLVLVLLAGLHQIPPDSGRLCSVEKFSRESHHKARRGSIR